MEFNEISQKAYEVRQKYQQFEIKTIGRPWTKQEILEGLIGDIGDLTKLIMAKEGVRQGPENIDESLGHELSDCLWCILVLAKEYDLDLENIFLDSMKKLDEKITTKLATD